MLEPIFAQLQHQILQSLLANLRDLLTISNSAGNFGRLQGHPSAFDDTLKAAAERYDLDPTLLKAIAHAESNFSPLAVSHAGAKGIMQLIDATACQLGSKTRYPIQNIDGGTHFLRQLLDRYDGNELLAVAAYNAGPDAVDRGDGLPPYSETQAYLPRVMDLRNQYRGWSA
jgi:soluble lytic murein transglycosylase-like protein